MLGNNKPHIYEDNMSYSLV